MEDKIKLAIVGSRTITSNEVFIKEISVYLQAQNIKFDNLVIISGGAKGIDSLAEAWANENNVPTIIYKPDYSNHGRSAPLVRNKIIAKECTHMLALWDGVSTGTIHVTKEASKLSKHVTIVTC